MGIWIRSQDKEDLINAESIFYDVDENTMDAEIWARTGMGGVRVGIYETKERCIRILDEIQSMIKTSGFEYSHKLFYVMPEN
jgi:alanine-alpha-ketoisovalerate/valine-pyruvate aminotransferase